MAKTYKIVVRLDKELQRQLDEQTINKGIIKSWYIRQAIRERIDRMVK